MTDERRWRFRWILYAAGAVLVLGAIRAVFIDADRTEPVEFAKYFVGSALLHDVILAPLVLGAGWLVVRRAPLWARGVIQAALIVSGGLTVVALPMVGGFGRRADNSSTLPQSYGRNLLLVLAVVWAIAGVALWRARKRLTPAAGSMRQGANR